MADETPVPKRQDLVDNDAEVIFLAFQTLLERVPRRGTKEELRRLLKKLFAWTSIQDLTHAAIRELIDSTGRSFRIYLDSEDDLEGDLDIIRTCLHRVGQAWLAKKSEEHMRGIIRKLVNEDVEAVQGMREEAREEDEEEEEEAAESEEAGPAKEE